MSLTIMKFSAVWCAPCRALQNMWDELVDEVSGVRFVSVDIDNEPKVASKYSIRSVPTILFLEDGNVVDSLIGLHKKADIKTKIDGLVKKG